LGRTRALLTIERLAKARQPARCPSPGMNGRNMAYKVNFFTNMLPNQHFDATLTFAKVGF
jgi:hypothetical protein